MLDANGMVRHVLVKIRENQQELEHAVALVRLRFVGAFFEIFDRGERIGEQPFQAVFRQRGAFTAARQSLVRAQECFVKKVVKAKFRAG
jgi:hypothetical protein